MPAFIRAVLLFLMLWQMSFGVSDSGLGILILFLHQLIKFLAALSGSQSVCKLSDELPKTVQQARQNVLGDSLDFNKYVVCSKCHALYDLNECVEVLICGERKSKKCRYIMFPNHPFQSFRKPCDFILLNVVKGKNKSESFKPVKVYCYQSLKSAVQRLVSRPGFLDQCELWRDRTSHMSDDILGDIYDGNVWKEFMTYNGKPFLADPFTWCVTLNVDWFQPFTHVCDSVGAIYLVVQNVPRKERYRWENMILVGVIPGPKEPSLNINSYLTPLVEELKSFWTGVRLLSPKYGSVVIKIALTCVACDLPATRKVCGFKSHNATKGCSRCLKTFATNEFAQKPDYSGFDTSMWPKRSIESHREQSKKHGLANTKGEQKQIEEKFGLRYSILLELPYFNPIRFAVIDPMHNLFLGTAKYVMHYWINHSIISNDQLQLMDNRVSEIHVPWSVGRLPTKISSGFAGFTADQWRNWTVIYSPVVLRGIVPNQHLQYWLLFVKSCILLSSRALLHSNIVQSHEYLKLFCINFQRVNGKESCTPNMHLHLHLSECLLDYGPVYGFWCYAFERFNGTLGRYPTNLKQIEVQLMKKCIIHQEVCTQQFPKEHETLFNLLNHRAKENSGGYSLSLSAESLKELQQLSSPFWTPGMWFLTNEEMFIPPVKEKVFDVVQVENLQQLYSILYPNRAIKHFSHFYKFCSRASIAGEVFGSVKSFGEKSSVISAYWPSTGNELCNRLSLSLGQVQFYIKHRIIFTDQLQVDEALEFTFAYVHWYIQHEHWDWFGSNCFVCYPSFHTPSVMSFIPLSRISSKCAFGSYSGNFGDGLHQTVFIAIPIQSSFTV